LKNEKFHHFLEINFCQTFLPINQLLGSKDKKKMKKMEQKGYVKTLEVGQS
jgi:hypothetical protein